MGRPKSDNPRDKKLNIRLTQTELDIIESCAKQMQKSRTDTIMYGINLIKEQKK